MYDDDDVRINLCKHTTANCFTNCKREDCSRQLLFSYCMKTKKRDAKTKQYVASVFVQGRTAVMRKTPFNDNCNNVFVVQSLLGFCWFGEVLQFYAKILIL